MARKQLKVYLNETASRWERRRPRSSPVDLSNSRHPHHILRFLELTVVTQDS